MTATDDQHPAEERSAQPDVPLTRGLSAKLLILTVLFVMLAEVLIFMPSVANFRLNWLEDRLSSAATASLILAQNGNESLPRGAQNDVLMAIGAKAIAVRDDGVSRIIVVTEMPPRVDHHIDLQNVSALDAMKGAIMTLFVGGNEMIRAFGVVGESDKVFEIVIPDTDLRSAMLIYARNVALLSLLISLITAGLVFWAINRIMIRPVKEMTRSMLAFAEAPDDASRIIRPEPRGDELGVAERELAAMQSRLHKTFGEQKHLADLGLAVSKINHDMRNILASAQLMSDRLTSVSDPAIQRYAPKLVRTIDRAVGYTESVLAYGKAQEAPPSRRKIKLHMLVEDVHGLLELQPMSGIEFENEVPPDLVVDADAEQLFRVLTNLARNAIQAMSADSDEALVRRICISASRDGSVSRILVADTGPGLPKKARDNLFSAFRGSARSGGTGLGLAIAHELVRAHGGQLQLLESTGGRTVFEITIPDQPARLDEARDALRRQA